MDIGAVVEDRLRAVAVVVVDIEHRHSLGTAVAQGLRGQRGVVQEAVAAEEVGPGVVAGRARQRQGAAGLALRHGTRRRERTGRTGACGEPASGHQRRAGVERVQAHAGREIFGQHVPAHAGRRPHAGQRVVAGVGRIEPDPLGPRVLDEVQTTRRVDPRQSGVQADAEGAVVRWVSQLEGTLPQRGQHMVQALRRYVARHEAAAEHLVAALVQVVQRVVEDDHFSSRYGNSGSLPVERKRPRITGAVKRSREEQGRAERTTRLRRGGAGP